MSSVCFFFFGRLFISIHYISICIVSIKFQTCMFDLLYRFFQTFERPQQLVLAVVKPWVRLALDRVYKKEVAGGMKRRFEELAAEQWVVEHLFVMLLLEH